MFKDKKIMAGGGGVFPAAVWFYIKPNYNDPPPPGVPPPAPGIAASPRPTVILGKPLPAGGGHGGG